MLDALVAQSGLDALVAARPYVGDDGQALRWVIYVDGHEVPEIDVHVVEDLERDRATIFLVRGDAEVELDHWRPSTHRHGPDAVLRTLRQLVAAHDAT